jgi:hypothetical protein
MKKYIIILFAIFIIQMPYLLFATDWNKPDKGYFTAQKDIDASVSAAYTHTMATIDFEGILFNFVNYRSTGDGKIIIRKLTNTNGFSPKWSMVKQDDITHLKSLSTYDWQPAPAIFNDVLYLFVMSKDGVISYSEYNAGADTWSALTPTSVNTAEGGNGMAATVVDGKLCLVYRDNYNNIGLIWTDDLETWNTSYTGLHLGFSDLDSKYDQLSAISTSCWINGEKTSKLIFAYIENDKSVTSQEYYFDDSNSLQQISYKTIRDQDDYYCEYQSVALIEGTVTDDPTSRGRCVQAFLKRDSKDNGYCRYRIKRFQLKDDTWTKAENNLVKQNYLWASHSVNLTAANLAIPTSDGSKDVRQFMCLIYRGYDDWDYPLNGAWAETNRLVFNGAQDIELAGPENTQYIGYIEGPPPFHLNNKNGLENPYEKNYERISEVEYSNSQSTSNSTELKFDVGGHVKVKAGWFRMDLKGAYERATASDTTYTVTATISTEAQPEIYGYYIKLTPIITRALYRVYDWKYDKNNPMNPKPIDTTYYCYMSEPKVDYENVDLQLGLVPGDLSTYMSRPIDFSQYTSSTNYYIDKGSNAWVPGSGTSQKIAVETSCSTSNVGKGELEIGGATTHEAFEAGFQGSIEYTMTTTTSQGNEITCWTRLNDPVDSTDVKHLNYDIFWINPIPNITTNWWLHEGALDQITWCVTYQVTYFETVTDTFSGTTGNYSGGGEPVFHTNVTDFTAINTPEGVKLNWQTLTETDNYGFVIERTSTLFSNQNLGETTEWESLGFVEGSKNSNTPKEYNFIDNAPPLGIISYRLKQLNTEQKFKYSGVVEIEVEQFLATGFDLAQNYPNPFNPTTNISFTVPENGYASLRIFNTLGQEVASLFNGEAKSGIRNQVQFNGTGMASGTYFSRLEYGGKVLLKKIQLMK